MPFYTGHTAPASNRADLLFDVEIKDKATDDFVDLTNADIVVALALTSQTVPTLIGTKADGHCTVMDDGVFRVHFTRAEMVTFPAGDLDIGITITMDGITYQILSGQLPIVHGVVAA
jgi:hypothetical protein